MDKKSGSKNEKTELVQVNQAHEALPVRSTADLAQVGEWVAQSGIFGQCSPGRGAVIAAMAYQEGLSLLEIKRRYHITQDGNVSMRSDRMLADFMAQGGVCEWKQYDDQAARAVFSFGVNKNIELAYTRDDAEKAGMFAKRGDAWEKHTPDMLRARLISKAVRMLAPQVCAGMYTPEEYVEIEKSNQQSEPVPLESDPPPINSDDSGDDDVQDAEIVDGANYNVCPISSSKFFKMPWSELDTEVLRKVVVIEHPDLTEEYVAAAEAELERRK
jgi:hypothetical protein